MKRGKINIIVKYFYPVAAGIETNITETYTVLHKLGWDVTIHTTQDTLTQKNCLETEGSLRGLLIKRYPHTPLGFFPKIDWNDSDLICLHNFNVFPHMFVMLFTLILKLLGKKKFKLVLTPHGGFNPEWSTFPRLQGEAKKLYHFTVGTWLINRSVDCVRAVSEWEKNEIIGKRVRKDIVEMVPNGIEDEAYMDVDKLASKAAKDAVKKYGRYIIQVGRIYPIKNYETTIKALPYIPKDVSFVIVGPNDHVMGKGNYRDDLMKLATKLGVAGRVIFAGILRGVDKYYTIKHAQMMVHMALWESFCNVVHEGLSQGLICIVANNTALPYLIKDKVHGYCIETQDSTEVANKINYVLQNKKSSEIMKMEANNKEYGLENSWEKTAIKIDAIYQKLIQ